MNNQAAQTMPELPEPFDTVRVNDFSLQEAPVFSAGQMRAYALAALSARPLPSDWVAVPREATDAMLSAWLTSSEKAGGKSGGDFAPWSRAIRCYRAMLAAAPSAPAASGGECNCGAAKAGDDDQTRHSADCATYPDPPASASVSERARELLAAEYMASKFAHDNAYGLCIKDGSVSNADIKFALRAIESALTQQRGSVSAIWPTLPPVQRWKMERGSDGLRWSVYMDHCKLGEWVKWEEIQQAWFAHGLALNQANTTPQPSASVVVPHQECYSENFDTWFDSPDDSAFVDGLKVGDTYKLQVSHYSIEREYVVTKVPDETNDDYEVRPVIESALTTAAGGGGEVGNG